MKNYKKIAALAGVVIILAVFCLPMIVATGSGEQSQGSFLAAMFIAFMIPFFIYIFMMMARILGNKKKEAESMIKNVIFDVGKVLVGFRWEEYLKEFGFPEEEYETIAKEVFCSQIWNERDKGLLTEEEYVDIFVSKAPQYEADIREVMRRTPETIYSYDYSETWLKYLKGKGYKIYILSNFSTYMLDLARPVMKFLNHVDGEIFSCNVKAIKPDAEIYEILLNRFSLKPEECVFLDDRAENCEAARKQGIHAIEFKNMKQAVNELEKLGVK